MFIILYYDINQKRTNKALKICRKYLVWVQNSVFEGEITEAKYKSLCHHLDKILIDEDGDSVIIYSFRTLKYSHREVLGFDKKVNTKFI